MISLVFSKGENSYFLSRLILVSILLLIFSFSIRPSNAQAQWECTYNWWDCQNCNLGSGCTSCVLPYNSGSNSYTASSDQSTACVNDGSIPYCHSYRINCSLLPTLPPVPTPTPAGGQDCVAQGGSCYSSQCPAGYENIGGQDCLIGQRCCAPFGPDPTTPPGQPTPTTGPTATPGGPGPTSTPPPSSGRWFQTYVGDVHSQGSLDANVPSGESGEYFSCNGKNNSGDGECNKINDLEDSDSGLITHDDAFANIGEGSETDTEWDQSSGGFERGDNKYGYLYYNNLFKNPATLTNENLVGLGTLNGFYKREGNLRVASSGNINQPNRKVVILVSGNLIIDNHQISVGRNNNFLAFIVGGDVEINGNRSGGRNNPDVEGVYIADGQIKTGSGGDQLYAGGIFVGWGGFSLQRTGGTSDPREVFIYRPDLLVNMPKEMKEEKVVWREVAP